MKNKTLLIVGGTDGIGKTIGLKAGNENKVIIVGRSAEKGEALVREFPNWEFYPKDMSEMRNVLSLAENLAQDHNHIDYIIHTADILLDKRVETKEGLEISVAINIYSRILLNHLLVKKYGFTPSRIMHIALAGAPFGQKSFMEDFPIKKEVSSTKAHMVGQIANDMYGLFLQRRLQDRVKVNILNPGMVDTDIRRNGELPVFMKVLSPIFDIMRPFIETAPEQYAEFPFSILQGKNSIAETNVLISPKGGIVKESNITSSERNQEKFIERVEYSLKELIDIDIDLSGI